MMAEATHIKSVVEGVLRQVKDRFCVQRCVDLVLDRIVDKETRRFISVKRIYKKTIVLSSGSSAALYNVNLKKTEILASVQQEMPKIEKIVIEVQ